MTSTFLKAHRRRGPVVSFLVLEILKEIQDQVEPASSAAEQCDMIIAAFAEAGTEISLEAAISVLQRLEAPAPTEKAEQAEVKIGKTMAEYLGGLDLAQLCLLASRHSFDEARHLYTEVDFEDAQFVVAEKTRQEMVAFFSLQEAIAVGFGGVEEGDKPAAKKMTGNAVAAASVTSLNGKLGILRGINR